jgi:AraC family transcriptional regulator of adaptative response / DNA-3-methyladenine glycosylase II
MCPARTPARQSCRFFATAAAAESAGFRPCLRCRPELAPGRPAYAAGLGEAVLARVQANAHRPEGIEALAFEIGLSSRQVRRILREQFGVTPIQIIQTQRLLFAKKLLHETTLSMTQVALAAGFGSVRRFNATFQKHYRLSPSQLRKQTVSRAGQTEGISLKLVFRAPLAFDAALSYLRTRATPGVETVVGNTYWRTVRFPAAQTEFSGWIAVTSVAGQNHLTVRVPAHLAPVLLALTTRLRALFDLDANPQHIDTQLAADPALARLVLATPGLRVIGAWDPFELALRAVLGQQISVAGATTLAGRMADRFGEEVDTPMAGLGRLAPKASRVARCTLDDVASIGLPRARAATIIALARFADGGGLRFSHGVGLEDMVQSLATVPGIGNWTAQYIAMRAFCQPDAFPAGDLGLKRALPFLDGVKPGGDLPSERALLARSEVWKPWRAYAAAHLWRSGAQPGP